MEVLGPPLKRSICFYSRVANGMSGWLTREDILYLIEYMFTYDTVSVQEWPNLFKYDKEWHGLRLKATKETKTKELRYLDGKKRLVTVSEFKDADTIYHFMDKEMRDAVKLHLENIQKQVERNPKN